MLLAACNRSTSDKPDASADEEVKVDLGKASAPAKLVVAKGIGAHLQKARRDSACVEAMQVEQAIEMYRLSERACPPSLQALVDGKFVSQLPVDPWKRPYVIACEDDTVSVTSLGPDGKADTDDDVVLGSAGCK